MHTGYPVTADAPSATDHAENAIVFVVDDDDAMRDSLTFLLESVSLETQAFDSAQAFLDVCDPAMQGCLLLDVRMPGIGGLKLQELLQERGIRLPVIIMTAYADVPMAVRAMRSGAVDFIEKPFNEQLLLDRIQQALNRDRENWAEEETLQPIRERWDQLSPREKEVMELVVEGMLNKQIAGELNLSIKTVEQHRARVMEKMGASSLAELVRMTIEAGIE